MRRRSVAALFIWLGLIVFPLSAFGDSLPIENGRYSGGPVIVVELTAQQQAALKSDYKAYGEMALTREQMDQIGKVSRMAEPLTKIIVVRAADTIGECTCGLANVGILFPDTSIEIPTAYLMTDKEAERRKIVD